MSSQTVFRFTSRDGIDALQAFKEPVPTAKEHEVVVKVRSVALNGRDIAIMNSTYPLPVKNQLIPCSDMAGEIVEVGGLVNGLSVGDSVIAPLNPSFLYGFLQDFHGFDTFGGLRDGVLREYIALPATAIIKLPKSSNSLTQWAAVVQAGSTVWNAFYGNKALKAGDTVLLLGTGGVSLIGLIFAKAAGATTIITSSSDEKLEYMKSIGADYTINYKTHPNWSTEVQRITNGQGVNHLLENGGSGTIQESLDSIARGGVISLIGFLSFAPEDKIPNVAMLAIAKGCIIRGIQGGSKQQLEEAVKLVGNRDLHIPVDKVFGFNRNEIVTALNYVASGKHTGKVCINLD